MRKMPQKLSDSPDFKKDNVDVMAQVLEAVHLTAAVFGRMELGAPWRLQVPAHDYLSFYVIARGSAWLELPAQDHLCNHIEGDGTARPTTIPLSAGDAVLLPRVSAHMLRDTTGQATIPLQFDYQGCPRVLTGEVGRYGGDGPVTSLITGHFTLGTASRNALLASLPPAIHLPANTSLGNASAVSSIISLIIHESVSPGPGGTIALGRLADLLFIHALRIWIASAGKNACGLRALADPAIGEALRLIHARLDEPWTVERLAAAVGLSRSGFAARFTELVGESPLQYLAQWRMTKAAQLLREHDDSVATIASKVGYANTVAFTKAFSRLQGVGPGAYRRQWSGSAKELGV
jgi:AraC-like DNA-binding protein